MSGLHKRFKTDNVKETEGVRIEFPEAQNDDGTIPVFILSRMGKANKAYQKAIEAATRPHRRQIQLETLNNDVAEELFLNVFVDVILKGWENIQNDENQNVPFSKSSAVALMKELPDVYERLQEEAKESTNFRDNALENEGKN